SRGQVRVEGGGAGVLVRPLPGPSAARGGAGAARLPPLAAGAGLPARRAGARGARARGGTGRDGMVTTGDFKRGLRVLVEGEPWTIEDYSVQTPSARGAATLVRTKLRHVVNTQLRERTLTCE